MRHCFFAVDLGATSGRAILGALTPEGVEMEEVSRFPNHLIETGGHFYWDIHELYRRMIEGLGRVARRADLVIDSIGIDTWGVDLVCVGKDGAILRPPYAYRDPHTTGAAEAFFSRIPRGQVYASTGIQVMDFNTLFQLDTMHRHADSALEAADKLLFMPDALSYMLTGEMVTEYTVASTSQMVNARARRWEERLLEAVGLSPESFGRFVYPGERIGVLTEEVRRMTGLGSIPVIAVAGHDTASAVASVPALDTNFAYLSSGTWSLMGIETDTPVITDEAEALNFTNEGGVAGTIRLLKNICGMWLLERCRAGWGDTSYAGLIAEAESCEPFRGLINPDDASFAHPADMERAIKDYCAGHRQPVPSTRGEVARCIFESLALRYRQVLDDLRRLSSHPIETLHVIGGGSKNALLNQWTANATGVPVVAGPSEATAMGNIMLQAIAAGEARDIASMRQQIHRSLPLQTFRPEATDAWEAAYRRFERFTQEN